MTDEMRQDDGNLNDMQLGSFNFLRSGWWILHIIAIAGVFYLGYLYGGAIFR